MNCTLSGLKIYNSSAGSGKTYSLIKEYLLILFYSENIYIFKNILVLTFTNQVVKEIKSNILNHLYQLSQGIKSELLVFISEKLNYSIYNIQLKAKKILNIIIHNYQFFSIYTIDKFYYKILYHYNLQYRLYEQIKIEFNINHLLEKTIKKLLNHLNKSELYSKILINFILYELNIGNTWNPYKFLMHLSSQLIQEKKFFYIEILKIYSINELIILNNLLNKRLIKIHQNIKSQSLLFFQELKKRNIIFQSFYRLLLPIFFEKLSNKNLLTNINTILNQKLDNIIFTNQIYSQKIDVVQKKILDIYITKIRNIYIITKKYLYQYILYSLIKKNILSIITFFKLNKILNEIKYKEKILFNIDIYKIINDQIKNYKITDIYENLGARYHYYFIDEFQDTSTIQWQNLYPLIENTLSEHGKVVLAGDIKQSIYRWRGSNIEQFFHFINIHNNDKQIDNSYINYRSYKAIVHFNNLFYSSIQHSFNNKKYLNIYNIQQTYFHKHDGYVELNLLKSKKNYLDTVYNTIKNKIFQLLKQGYQAMDIAILVRKNEEGSILSDLFNYDGITVVNSDYLLLKNFWQIKCIISILRILADPTNMRLRINWLLNMKKMNKIQCTNDTFHNLLSQSSSVSIELFFQILTNYGINFNTKFYLTTSIITLIKNIITAIKLNEQTSIIIIQFFLDFILNNIEEYGNSISKFLEIWDLKKDKESIILSESINAIKIMTIHKAKGLEFSIVFLPFLYWKIFKEKDLENWSYIYSNYLKNINIELKYQKLFNLIKQEYNKTIDEIYIDNINLLYVSTTRAIEQLIIFTINNKKNNTIAFYLKNFLIQQKLYFDNKIQYTFGVSHYKKNKINIINKFNNFSIYSNQDYSYQGTDISNSISEYNQLSNDIQYQSLIMIQYISNINIILKKIYYKFYFHSSNLFEILKKKILSIIYNIDLQKFYIEKYKIQLQSKILFQGKIIQINRLIFANTKIVIIDYVTNGSYDIHIIKIKDSIKALLNMGYKNIEAVIIYVHQTIEIIHI